MEEKILKENPNRFVIFPIEHNDIWEYYQQHQSAFWTAEEVDLSNDIRDWENLSENEKYFVKNVLSFFAASDGIVNENLAENFYREVQYPEAKFFYGMQLAMENIHSLMYSLLIDTYISNEEEKVVKKYNMSNIEKYILDHIDDITVEKLREDSGYTKNVFYKIFSRYYDVTPKQLIDSIKEESIRKKRGHERKR